MCFALLFISSSSMIINLNHAYEKILDSGTVDFEEFINMMSKFRKVKTSNELDDELMEIFNVIQFYF